MGPVERLVRPRTCRNELLVNMGVVYGYLCATEREMLAPNSESGAARSERDQREMFVAGGALRVAIWIAVSPTRLRTA